MFSRSITSVKDLGKMEYEGCRNLDDRYSQEWCDKSDNCYKPTDWDRYCGIAQHILNRNNRAYTDLRRNVFASRQPST
jgi:hypothetical protein